MASAHRPAARPGDPYRNVSLWWRQLPGELSVRPALPGDRDVDVAIVGAGFSGLWTALSLARLDATLRIAIVEREVAGFGASGRNGGWCSALFAASERRVARQYGSAAARAMRVAMQDAVDDVDRQARDEGIDCHFTKGGTIAVARNDAQVARGRSEIAHARSHQVTEEDLRWLDREEATSLVGASGVLGGVYTPHCASLDPARLVRGLADAVVRRGVSLFEGTTATEIVDSGKGRRPEIRTKAGTLRADVVVRAVEGWTSTLNGEHRTLAPIYSLMVATEPLPDAFWSSAGLKDRPTFADLRHLIIYGQRTADGRLAFGGRGAPYHLGSRIRPRFDHAPRVHRQIADTLRELFPDLSEAVITDAWGGPIGVPRDWFSSVGFDAARGLAWAGGYVGDGVSTSNLAGRTLADLILGRDSELVHLPWVGHSSPRWEPEPLRWLEVNAALMSMRLADAMEARSKRPSGIARFLDHLIGG